MRMLVFIVAALLSLNAGSVRAEDTLPGSSLYNIPDHWSDQNGRDLTLRGFAGRPVILAMIYTGCPQMCPLTVEAMRRIEKEIPEAAAEHAQFVLVSFDDVHDTPRRLKAYASQRNLDPSRWTLLHGDAHAVRQLAAALSISYRRDKTGDFDHGFAVVLLDKEGVMRFRQTELSQDPAVWTDPLRQLAQGAAR